MQRTRDSFIEQSDRDLERRVGIYLAGQHVPGLRHLEIEVENGTVTLRGRVGSFYERQLCQSLCRRVAGVLQYVDAIDVAYPSERVTVLA
jgi:osmotically-inducible protein OsmY